MGSTISTLEPTGWKESDDELLVNLYQHQILETSQMVPLRRYSEETLNCRLAYLKGCGRFDEILAQHPEWIKPSIDDLILRKTDMEGYTPGDLQAHIYCYNQETLCLFLEEEYIKGRLDRLRARRLIAESLATEIPSAARLVPTYPAIASQSQIIPVTASPSHSNMIAVNSYQKSPIVASSLHTSPTPVNPFPTSAIEDVSSPTNQTDESSIPPSSIRTSLVVSQDSPEQKKPTSSKQTSVGAAHPGDSRHGKLKPNPSPARLWSDEEDEELVQLYTQDLLQVVEVSDKFSGDTSHYTTSTRLRYLRESGRAGDIMKRHPEWISVSQDQAMMWLVNEKKAPWEYVASTLRNDYNSSMTAQECFNRASKCNNQQYGGPRPIEFFSEDDDRKIINHCYNKKSVEEIAILMRRPPNAIQERAQLLLGGVRQSLYPTPSTLALEMAAERQKNSSTFQQDAIN
ncbi:hypothetical protein BCR34DRAFT_591094 [Clohesyomyces aquaticus]|uniref:Myb-like domain-containing protein n=1 Tax=Clohesyomyces aquaticus TaxID=1231657 RepID=A0A1Y1Z3B4_9PLEO|nr:hypothetical protein BCR34DRAFT_591094 [Clohesyomyces aquaticus]